MNALISSPGTSVSYPRLINILITFMNADAVD